jgi:hypothetical protein
MTNHQPPRTARTWAVPSLMRGSTKTPTMNPLKSTIHAVFGVSSGVVDDQYTERVGPKI